MRGVRILGRLNVDATDKVMTSVLGEAVLRRKEDIDCEEGGKEEGKDDAWRGSERGLHT